MTGHARARRGSPGVSTEATPQSLRDFLGQTGQVGLDMLEVDWEATPLGPIDEWPNAWPPSSGCSSPRGLPCGWHGAPS